MLSPGGGPVSGVVSVDKLSVMLVVAMSAIPLENG
jgi:uncharacterized membrane protein